MSTITYPGQYRALHRGRHRAAEPTLHRPLLAALAVLVTLFAASVTAGWRLAAEVPAAQLAGNAAASVTDLVPDSGVVKAFAALVIVVAFIRRNT